MRLGDQVGPRRRAQTNAAAGRFAAAARLRVHGRRRIHAAPRPVGREAWVRRRRGAVQGLLPASGGLADGVVSATYHVAFDTAALKQEHSLTS